MSSSLTGGGCRLLGLFQHFQRDISGSNLAKRYHGRLIVFPFNGRFCAVGQAAGTLRGQQHQVE